MTAGNVQLCEVGRRAEREGSLGVDGHLHSGFARYVKSFWSQVDTSGGLWACWPWTGGRDTAGYGHSRFGWTTKAHREAYRLTHPDFDRSLDICHTCDSPPCCNPAHLWAGTAKENLRDAALKGRLGARPLDWPQVHAIRAAWARGTSQANLSRRYAVSQALISFIVNNRRWIEPAEGLER